MVVDLGVLYVFLLVFLAQPSEGHWRLVWWKGTIPYVSVFILIWFYLLDVPRWILINYRKNRSFNRFLINHEASRSNPIFLKTPMQSFLIQIYQLSIQYPETSHPSSYNKKNFKKFHNEAMCVYLKISPSVSLSLAYPLKLIPSTSWQHIQDNSHLGFLGN